MRPGKWTDEQTETLKKLYEDKLSASEIAAQMNCGFTRNAVIGRIHRLGLPLRGQVKGANHPAKKDAECKRVMRVVRANSNSTQVRMYEAAEIEMAPIRCAEIEPRKLSLIDLEPGDCRYPYGEDSIVFCGHPKFNGGSYCLPHLRLSTANRRTNSEAVTEARARRMRGINFRRSLLEGTA